MINLREKISACFSKAKKYYYDNYGLLFYKKKIADFQCDSMFEDRLNELTLALDNYEKNNEFFSNLIKKIKIRELSKNVYYAWNNEKNGSKRKLEFKTNYFIELPVELVILDSLLVCEFANVFNKYKSANEDFSNINHRYYSNQLDLKNNDVYNDNKLYKYYKKDYDRWKNDLCEKVRGKDGCTILKLDIKECFYTAKYELKFFVDSAKGNPVLLNLLNLYFKIADTYKDKVNKIKKNKIKNQCFPVGMLASNILFEYYMYKSFDVKVEEHKNMFLGRYVDDMYFVIDGKYSFDDFIYSCKDLFEIYKNKNYKLRNTGFKINNNKIRYNYLKKDDEFINFKIKKLFEKNNISEQNIIEYELSEKPKYDSNGNETDMNILRKAQIIMDIYLDYGIVDENDELIKAFKNEIENLFQSYKLINYRASWTKFFEFIILVYNKEENSINNLINSAKQMITKKVKKNKLLKTSLIEELDIALSLAKASYNIITENNITIKKAFMYKIFDKDINDKINYRNEKYVPFYISSEDELFNEFINPISTYKCDTSNYIMQDEKNIDDYVLRYIDFDYSDDLICEFTNNNSIINEIGIVVANVLIDDNKVKEKHKHGTTHKDKKEFLEILEYTERMNNNYGKKINYLVFP